jgi:hypothetical protein
MVANHQVFEESICKILKRSESHMTTDQSHTDDEQKKVASIHPEASPFEPGYQPETLPKLHVPDLPADAQGLSADALAQIPTLTEQVEVDVAVDSAASDASPQALTEPVVPEIALPDEAELPALVAEPTVSEAIEAESPSEPALVGDEPIQETTVQADTWTEVLHARMGKLTDDIQALNGRLDRLEERSKTKV